MEQVESTVAKELPVVDAPPKGEHWMSPDAAKAVERIMEQGLAGPAMMKVRTWLRFVSLDDNVMQERVDLLVEGGWELTAVTTRFLIFSKTGATKP
jgi:hypothetical protein